jgi:hypothetical protein
MNSLKEKYMPPAIEFIQHTGVVSMLRLIPYNNTDMTSEPFAYTYNTLGYSTLEPTYFNYFNGQ